MDCLELSETAHPALVNSSTAEKSDVLNTGRIYTSVRMLVTLMEYRYCLVEYLQNCTNVTFETSRRRVKDCEGLVQSTGITVSRLDPSVVPIQGGLSYLIWCHRCACHHL